MPEEAPSLDQLPVNVNDVLDQYDADLAQMGRELRIAKAQALGLQRELQAAKDEALVLTAQLDAAKKAPGRARGTAKKRG